MREKLTDILLKLQVKTGLAFQQNQQVEESWLDDSLDAIEQLILESEYKGYQLACKHDNVQRANHLAESAKFFAGRTDSIVTEALDRVEALNQEQQNGDNY